MAHGQTKFVLRESGVHDYAKRKIAEWVSASEYSINRPGVFIEYPIISDDDSYMLLDERQTDLFPALMKLSLLSVEEKLWYETEQQRIEYAMKQRGVCKYNNEFASFWQRVGKLIERVPTQPQIFDVWVPTYDACKKAGLKVVAVADVVVPHKGHIRDIWEVTHTHGLTHRKAVCMMRATGCEEIYEISADWVLRQNVHEAPQVLYNAAKQVAKKWSKLLAAGHTRSDGSLPRVAAISNYFR
jgi:hypothetical protein